MEEWYRKIGIFFFSSRRRHTRLQGDWSSDVCSSDLTKGEKLATTFDYLFRNFFRGLFRRFKRYGYAIVTFGNPISIDELAREHPEILAETFETRSEEHTSELQSPCNLVCRLLLEKKKKNT